MKSKKTNINKKTVHIDQKTVKNVQKVLQNVKKSQKTTKKDAKTAKLYSEDQIKKIACMVFMLECQAARLAASVGLFFGDEINKHELLKEFMAVDRTMRKYSTDFHKEIEETVGKFRVFASDGKDFTEIKNGGVYATDKD